MIESQEKYRIEQEKIRLESEERIRNQYEENERKYREEIRILNERKEREIDEAKYETTVKFQNILIKAYEKKQLQLEAEIKRLTPRPPIECIIF